MTTDRPFTGRPAAPDPDFCPAFGAPLSDARCWEWSMAGQGGPTDAAAELATWIRRSGRHASMAAFHAVCASCPRCPFVAPRP